MRFLQIYCPKTPLHFLTYPNTTITRFEIHGFLLCILFFLSLSPFFIWFSLSTFYLFFFHFEYFDFLFSQPLDSKSKQNHGGLYITISGEIRRYAKGKGTKENPTNPSESMEFGDEHEYTPGTNSDNGLDACCHHAKYTTAGQSSAGSRCHNTSLTATAATIAGRGLAAAAIAR